MKIRMFCVLAWVGGVRLVAAGESGAGARAKVFFREEFRFDPTVARAGRGAGAEPVVEMAPLRVTNSKIDQLTAAAVDDRQRAAVADQFTFEQGGTLKTFDVGRVRGKVGLMPRPDLGGWTLFKLSR